MKIIQEKYVYEDGEKYYCIYFDDNTYVCLEENEYYDLLKIIENGNQSDIYNFIENSSTRNISNSAGEEISNIGMFFSIIIGIGTIWVCVKIWYYLPLIIGILILITGIISLIIGGIINHKFPHILRAILYGIVGTILFSLNMFFLLFMSYLGHIGMTMSEVDQIHRASGFDKNTDVGFYLTIIGSFLLGAYKDSIKN